MAETGSLSAAARRLGVSQPTVGRHVQALEQALGVSLFRRTARGMAVSEEAAALLEPARAMQRAAGALQLAVAGRESELEGTVRITSAVFVAHHILPAVLASLRRAEPRIAIELVPSDASQNLLFREADIAVRMYRPRQLDVVTQHLGDVKLGAFAASNYLDRHGRPASDADMADHDLVGFDRDETIIRGMQGAGWKVTRENFAVRCDHQTVYWELVRAGCGIGFGQLNVGLADEGLERVLPGLDIPPLPMWLAAHPTLRHTPRVARTWELLAAQLRNAIA